MDKNTILKALGENDLLTAITSLEIKDNEKKILIDSYDSIVTFEKKVLDEKRPYTPSEYQAQKEQRVKLVKVICDVAKIEYSKGLFDSI
jgi:hypothetical protein